MHKKGLPSTPSETLSVQQEVEMPRDAQPSRPTAVRFQSDTAVPVPKFRKRSSNSSVVGSAPKTDTTLDAPYSGAAVNASSWLKSPDITVSSPPALSANRKTSSYFPQAPPSQRSSDDTSTSGLSPMATNWEDVAAESKAAGPPSEETTPASPFSKPRRRPNALRRQRTLSQMYTPPVIHELPSESIVSVVPSGPVMGPPAKYKSSDGKEYHRTALTGPAALNFLPSETKRVNTPPMIVADAVSKKPGGFKGFFLDMRSVIAEQSSVDSESPEPVATKRRRPIIPRGSLQSLLPKLSLPRLQRKASQQTREPPEPPRDPLEVTAFHQTPFSQRYGDTRRIKMNHIRSFVEESLKDDDDDASTFLFELDVPDHLPSSPLCPLSPKHKSGGKAICPIHSRRKTNLGQSGVGGKAGEAGKGGGARRARLLCMRARSSRRERGRGAVG